MLVHSILPLRLRLDRYTARAARRVGHDAGLLFSNSSIQTAELALSKPRAPSNIEPTSHKPRPKTFAALEVNWGIAPQIRANIPYKAMTDVQKAAIPDALLRKDIIVYSKPGTGKTLAYLVPAIHQLLTHPPKSNTASIIIIAPTRELVLSISRRARELLAGTAYNVKSLVGGQRIDQEQKDLGAQQWHILVATPGRFAVHINKSCLKDILTGVRTLILDEADVLLEPSFANEMKEVIKALPYTNRIPRQTMIFTSTLHETIKAALSICQPDTKFISTVPIKEPLIPKKAQIQQEYAIATPSDVYPTLIRCISEFIAANTESQSRAKIIVFNSTAATTELTHRFLRSLDPPLPLPIYQVHSHMDPKIRDSATGSFQDATSAILVSSDLTSRGMDFSDIGLVIQLGIPPNPDQYALRLAQTGRAGVGKGLIILSSYEKKAFFKEPEIKKLPLIPIKSPTPVSSRWREQTIAALRKLGRRVKMKAYRAWLGYYYNRQETLKWDSSQLVLAANSYAEDTLLYNGKDARAPPIDRKTAGKLEIEGIVGLNVVYSTARTRNRQPQLRTANNSEKALL